MSERPDDLIRLMQASLDEPGPARRLSDLQAAELVQAVCDEAEQAPQTRPRRRRWLTGTAAAIALGAALSASATVGWMRLRDRGAPAVAPAPLPQVAAPPARLSAPAVKPRPEPTRAPPRERRAAIRVAPAAPARSEPRARPIAAVADQLARANRLRAERRWQDAADAYAAVMVDGDARAAYVAALARATLLLDRLHRPAEALVLFRRALALAPAGALSDEALYGVAASSRALGDEGEERAALERLLAERPHSLLRPRVEARLTQLRAR